MLGSFFENFLRYGNTSKELGIVLTPRHICWLAAEVLDIKSSDIVYDPAAGTAGFLIAAFNRIKSATIDKQARDFAKNNLYGVEVAGKVAALAFINMYFRGDGKHNLKIDSCFPWRITGNSKASIKPQFKEGIEKKKPETLIITRVMMNPPFALKDDAEKEYHFVDHGLKQLPANGLLFSVLPASVMYEKQYKTWRDLLLENNSLLAVVSFPTDLFYPIATESLGIFIRKGVPHDLNADVLWARISDDGFTKRKGFRVEKKGARYQSVLMPLVECLRAWVVYGSRLTSLSGEYEFSPISSLELIPQAHLGTPSLNYDSFSKEVTEIYKNLTVQLWDQQQNTGGITSNGFQEEP